ncbi:hypothetical protein R1flu_014239 [Riccia fluitans]|uniref:Uncharacterized protein n=1 Tax=Riccia fluitans TaxID=41844 RepID=A0ABD1YFI7_9MARC
MKRARHTVPREGFLNSRCPRAVCGSVQDTLRMMNCKELPLIFRDPDVGDVGLLSYLAAAIVSTSVGQRLEGPADWLDWNGSGPSARQDFGTKDLRRRPKDLLASEQIMHSVMEISTGHLSVEILLVGTPPLLKWKFMKEEWKFMCTILKCDFYGVRKRF